MFAMASAWLITLGGTTALGTLASSSFTGSQNKHDLGVLPQHGIVVLSGLYTVVAVIWAASEHIFRALGREGYVTVEAAKSSLDALLNYLFIFKAGLGLSGAPIVTGISYWCSFLLLIVYVMFSVIMEADQIIYTIPFGLGVVTSVRAGNLLGAQENTPGRLSCVLRRRFVRDPTGGHPHGIDEHQENIRTYI
ncbi:hypothetical protein DL771_007456 [Monosporascus sp. 5C6A]|nr:hypothetical protein DL771_007456 [Monosporascus sp. 5C6A]